ncbi:MAG: translation initiation factor [Francisellaceae bacterium]|nr:translation initiation factor [Francisellaceae bacterium]
MKSPNRGVANISVGKDTAPRNRVDNQIKALEVRLIGLNGEKIGVVSLREAQRQADEVGSNLVEISGPNTAIPVVQIMDYGKFLFEKNKERTIAKKKQKQIKVKEIKFRPGTDVGDYEIKLRNIRGFLEDGDKVKVTVFFRGREMAHQELGKNLLERVKADLEEHAKVEYFPKMEGRQLIMILASKKK